jgi:hypothetical protein
MTINRYATVEASSWAAMFRAQEGALEDQIREVARDAASDMLDNREDDLVEQVADKVAESREFARAIENAVTETCEQEGFLTERDLDDKGFVDEQDVERQIEEALDGDEDGIVEKAAAGAVRAALGVQREVAQLREGLRAAESEIEALHRAQQDRARLSWWRRMFA